MPLNPPRICSVEPFIYQATPQMESESGASAGQVNDQHIENYLNRLREALCLDIQSVIDDCCNGAGGSGSFLGLDDTPASYAGESLKHVRVNALADGLDFVTVGAGGALPSLSDNTTVLSGRSINGNPTSFRLVHQAGFLGAGTTDIVHSLGAFTNVWIVQATGQRLDTTPSQWLHLPHVHQATVGFNINMFVRDLDVRIVLGASWTGINPNRIADPRILLEFY